MASGHACRNHSNLKQHGYLVQVMTGVAWGQYQDYLDGQFDGEKHWTSPDRQQRQDDPAWRNADIPYISPGENYGKYLATGVKRAWTPAPRRSTWKNRNSGLGAVGRKTLNANGRPTTTKHGRRQIPLRNAQYRASKLKYYLYRRALSQVFDFARQYGKTNHRTIRCYVPTHSLINYAQWRIVSPESSLIDVGADGYIAQVWTGTARTPNLYEGRRKERTFETAFLE